MPCYSFWDKFFYGAGLKIYDFLSGKYSFGKSKILSKKETLERLPNLKSENLRGGIVYFDGQFDDTRLLINLAQTACEQRRGCCSITREFSELIKDENDKIDGVKFQDAEIGRRFFTRKPKSLSMPPARFAMSIRKLSDKNSKNIIAPSQGIHLVFAQEFLPSENALMIPKTSDGRVLFAIPWHRSNFNRHDRYAG